MKGKYVMMRSSMKILAVLMAMLMLVSMATACKSTDDEMDGFITGDTNISDNSDDGDVDIDDEGNDPSNPSDEKEEGKDPEKNETNKPSKNDKEENKKDPTDTDNVDEEKWEEIAKDYDETKKYDADANPLIAEAKPLNHGVGVSFDLDTTGFVKNNIKLADLKGKTFIMITAIDEPFFYYKDENGTSRSEWDWWDSLRNEYGVKVKYIKTALSNTISQNLTYQTSGKQVDIMPTHRSWFPQWMNLSQALDPHVNVNYIGNSPGVDLRTLQQTKWGGTYRAIAPIGAVDVMWYNESMVDQLGLKDPHETWKAGKWDWNAWKEFMVSIPAQGPTGLTLCPWSQSERDSSYFWPQTAGITLFGVDSTSKEPKLINNFNDERVSSALIFYADTVKSVDYIARRVSGYEPWGDLFTKGTFIMTNTKYLTKDFSDSDFAMGNKFNWVPYPRSTHASGVEVAMNYGATMMIPRKVKVEKNIPYAVKFMELWANRFTEAIFDFQKSGHLQFNYAQRKEYYEFATQNNYFAIGAMTFEALSGDDKEYWKQLYWSLYNEKWNTATAIEKLRNLAAKACDEAVKFGN